MLLLPTFPRSLERPRGYLPRGSSKNTACSVKQIQWHRHVGPTAEVGSSSRGTSASTHDITSISMSGISSRTTLRNECLPGSVHGPLKGEWRLGQKKKSPVVFRKVGCETSSKEPSTTWRTSHSPERSSTISAAQKGSKTASACLRPCTADMKRKR